LRGYSLLALLITFLSSDLAFTQTISVKSISDEDTQVLVREGWQLVYSTDQVRIVDFDISRSGLIISTIVDGEYHLILLNKEHLVQKDKRIAKVDKLRVAFPYFFNSGNQKVFGPCDKLYFEIDMDKYKINRRRYPFKINRRPFIQIGEGYDTYYKQDSYYKTKSKDFGAVTEFDRVKKIQYQYLLDYSLSEPDTLYEISYDTDMMIFSSVYPFLQFEVLEDKGLLYILDNQNGVLSHLDNSGRIQEVNLAEFDIQKSGLFRSFTFNLEKDIFSDQVYLICTPYGKDNDSKIFKIRYDGNLEIIKNEKLKSISSSSKIHNGKVYDIFKIKESRKTAVYSIGIE
tara:strand:- start:5671 stop:6699 length:1029 start_codon:yes stop_codon:yes gene_type:complete